MRSAEIDIILLSLDYALRTTLYMFRPRLFSLMLAAFALVIVLGIGGMVGFFGLAVSGLWRFGQSTVAVKDVTTLEQESAAALARYYTEHGSWEGVRRQIDQQDADFSPNWISYVLVDADGNAVASSQSGPRPGAASLPPLPDGGVPIDVDGKQVGKLYLVVSRFGAVSDRQRWVPPVIQGFISAGLGLAAVLLGLATFFSSRISTPLRRVTHAAQTLAGGDMSVRVRGHPVREIDELGRAFNTMANSLAAADQQRRQLTADVAHELRTPLSIIKGRLEGMQDGVYQATPDQIAGLLDETALLERLIEDLRLLALADAGQLPLYPEPVETIPLLHDLVNSFAQQASQRGVTLRLDLPNDLPDIHADPQRIAQVLSNMLSNALRYTPVGGTVTLRVRPQDTRHETRDARREPSNLQSSAISIHPSSLFFEVSDTGSGITPEDLPHIFDRFWRADRARTRSSGGAGLGLAIARRIVEAHGGEIWATSAPGQGTTLTFSLPLADEVAEEIRGES